jgi:hypothetical protein
MPTANRFAVRSASWSCASPGPAWREVSGTMQCATKKPIGRTCRVSGAMATGQVWIATVTGSCTAAATTRSRWRARGLGPTEFESALVSHPLVAEAVAVGVPDPIKGEAVVCFVTLHGGRTGLDFGSSVWESELSDHVARMLGKPLRPSRIHVLAQIPKTRNGKVLRRVVRNAYIGRPMGDLSSMENPRSIDEVINLRKVWA